MDWNVKWDTKRPLMYTEDIISAHGGSIAVVCNGHLGDYGRLIDRHDVVIRFNHFRLRRHRQKCGSKTTLWCTHAYVRATQAINLRDIPAINPFILEKSKHNARFERLHSRLIYARMPVNTHGVEHPTTGLGMILLVASLLKREVDVFGFDGLKTGHYWNPNHKHTAKHNQGQQELNVLRKISLIHLHE